MGWDILSRRGSQVQILPVAPTAFSTIFIHPSPHIIDSIYSVAWLAKTALTDEEKLCIKALALDIVDLRKKINELAEALAKMNDKQFKEAFAKETKEDLTEKQVDKYQLSLQKQVDNAENEFRY
jgi:hypothetical protein